MKRISRTLAAALAGTVATTGLLVALPGSASADTVGQVTVSPTTGTDATGFGGSATTACPVGTDSAFWSLEGGTLTPGQAFLGDSTNTTGTGPQSFSGASIANIETVAGPLTDGTYFVQFSCYNGPTLTDTYRANLNYTAAGDGSWNITAAALTPVSTTTVLSSDAGGPVEQGTVVNLTATITPASGSAPSSGSVEFFDGATSLGTDNTVASGVATLPWTTSTIGARSLTAVFTPAAPSGPTDRGFAGSTSAPHTVDVTSVAPRSTSSVLTVTPTSGNAYQSVDLSCAVAASTGSPVGTANFLDGASALGSAPVSSGVAALTTTSLGAGAHSLTCAFVGTDPYQNSTSAAVPASYTQAGAPPDDQTVTVTIPQGALTITTPYTPTAPLHLGTAVLDPGDSTYSASATFGSPTEGYITINDTRAGNLGWAASLVAGTFSNGSSIFPGSHAGLTVLTAVQVAGNALQASNVALADTVPFAPGLGSLTQFASYASGLPTGTANITGTFGVDQVPTSITPGLYTSTVTFTAV